MNAGWAACSRGRCSTSDRKPSSVSHVLNFPEKVKKVLRLWRQNFPSYKRSSGAIIMSLCIHLEIILTKGSSPRNFRAAPLKSFDTKLGLLGKLKLILVLLRGCFISWITSKSPTANFEWILFADTCQQRTISQKNVQASLSMRRSSFCRQAAQI